MGCDLSAWNPEGILKYTITTDWIHKLRKQNFYGGTVGYGLSVFTSTNEGALIYPELVAWR